MAFIPLWRLKTIRTVNRRDKEEEGGGECLDKPQGEGAVVR